MPDTGENENIESDNSTNQEAVTTIEDIAQKDGWVPKDEFKGDPSLWRSAEIYVDRKETMGETTRLRGENKAMKEQMKQVTDHIKQVRKASYNQAMKDLKGQYKEAVLDGEEDKAEQIDKAMEDERIEYQKESVEHNAPSEAYESWHDKNDWYQKDRAMTIVAEDIAGLPELKDKSESEVYEAIDKGIRESFPHKFQNPNRQRGGVVESGSNGNSDNNGKFTLSDLTGHERKAIAGMVANGIITEEEYLKDIELSRGVS